MIQGHQAHFGDGTRTPRVGTPRALKFNVPGRLTIIGIQLFALFLIFSALPSVPALAAAPAAGSSIDNTAYISYTGNSASIRSNTVRAEVLGAESFTLVNNRLVTVPAGSQVTLNHTITNTGNTISTYTLTLANLTGDGFDINGLTLHRNIGNTGTLAPTDPVIPQGGTITLNPGESAVLIITGAVPAATGQGVTATIRIGATSTLTSTTAGNTDSITVPTAARVQLAKSASQTTLNPGDLVTFTVQALNSGGMAATGTTEINGSQLMVGGSPAQLVVVRDVIPANTAYQAGSLNCSAGATPLYHASGDPAASYRLIEPLLADEVGCGISSLDVNATETLSFGVRLNPNAAGTVTNMAQAFYNNGAVAATATTSSNTVVVTLPSQPPAIAFYTDSNYTRTKSAAGMGVPHFVQASASQCNADPLTSETKVITVTSALTGDLEAFTAVETGPNTGYFRIVPNVQVSDAATNPVAHGNGILEELKNDIITATVQGCGSASVDTVLYIDPLGILFDSRTNAPLAGAEVTLIDVTGNGNGGNPGAAAKVLALDGTTAAPATLTTGPDGSFQFMQVSPGTYRLNITAPNGFRFPSSRPIAQLPADRIIDPSGSYGGVFNVSAATDFVRFDVPLDSVPASGLFAEKTASVKVAEPGDFVDYSIKVQNRTGKLLAGVTLTDTLPSGFSYQSGSLRIQGAPAADPDGGHGPRLVFPIGDLAVDAVVTLTYRIKIGPGAFQGDGINRAQAAAANGTASNVASARVQLVGGVFSDRGFIIGKFFTDCNRNRVQDPEELGIPGVRLYLEDGTFVITDSEGKFSLYNISPRTHVLKVDNTTLPAGAELVELSNRNAGDAGSLFIDMKSGEMHKANFAEGSCNTDVMKEVKMRRSKGEIFTAETDRTLNRQLAYDAAPATADIRALPAMGTVGADVQLPSFSEAETVKGSKPLTGTGPVPPSPNRALEEIAPQLSNGLAFIGLKDKDVLPYAQTTIRVKGPTWGTLKLLVNGEEPPAKQMGKKVIDTEHKIEMREYIGIDLKPGPNDLRLQFLDQFGNRRGEQKITIMAPGKLSQILISVPEGEPRADGKTPLPVSVRLADDNGVPITFTTPLTLETSLGKWQVNDLDEKEPGTQVRIEGGKGTFLLLPPQEASEAVIRIKGGSLKEEKKVYFYPDLRPMIAAGLVEGTINLRTIGSDALVPARAQDGFEQELSTYSFSGGDGRQQGGARAALFLKGKIKGDCLLTLSYDSDKDTREALFRDIQPDQFYPVYGDSSIKGFDAQSTGRFYVRIDKNKSYLLYGDFVTPAGSDVRVLGAYNRSLNGIKGHYEDNRVSADTFASRDTATQVVEELAGQGISGPYFLSKSGYIANSEKVEIITRDRNQPSLVLKSVPQTRFTDYEIEELSGRILFKSPVPTLDQEMNPVFIRVIYETDQGGDKFWVAGANAQVKLHERLEVGGSYVRDENPLDKADLKSANATVKLFDKTFLIGEWAQAFKESAGRGDAQRFELRHDSDRIQARVYGVKTDAVFDNPNSTYGKGRKEAGAKIAWKANSSTTVSAEALHSEDVTTSGSKDGLLASVMHNFGTYLQAELGVRHSHESTAPSQPGGAAVTPNDVTSLRTKLTGKLPQLPKLSVTGEYEQSLAYGDRRMAAGGAEYQLSVASKLYARHEFISSLAGPYNLNGSQQQNSTQVGVDTEYMKNGKLFSEYRVRDAVAGRDAEAAIGLKNGWSLTKGVKLNTTLERVQKLDGATDSTATAVTGALEYTASPLWKGTVRLEVRTSSANNTLLNTFGVACKLSRNITLLGRQYLSFTDNKGITANVIQERVQAGFAYRPTDTDTWNVLARYEFKYESNGTLNLPLDRTVHIVSTHLNYQPAKALTMSARYAGKLVFENSNGLDSTSNTHLLSGRTMYDLTSKWDMGLNYSALFSDLFKSCRYGVGGEVGYLVATNLWLSTGYNIYGFTDKDLTAEEYTAQGVYFRFRFKFDEDLFSGNDPKVNKLLPMKEIARAER